MKLTKTVTVLIVLAIGLMLVGLNQQSAGLFGWGLGLAGVGFVLKLMRRRKVKPEVDPARFHDRDF